MGLRAWALAALIAAGAVGIAFAEDAKPAPEPKPAQIDRNGVLILVRSSLLAVDQANKTGNYTVLRDLGAPGFQASNTAAKLGDIFASLRRDKLDLSGVAVLDPQLTLLPQIEASGMMHMAGFFPSVPAEVKFELLYAPVEGQWKLYGISVGLAQSGPAAPQPPLPPQAAAPNPRRPRLRLPPRSPQRQRNEAGIYSLLRSVGRLKSSRGPSSGGLSPATFSPRAGEMCNISDPR